MILLVTGHQGTGKSALASFIEATRSACSKPMLIVDPYEGSEQDDHEIRVFAEIDAPTIIITNDDRLAVQVTDKYPNCTHVRLTR